jgi:Domain of unknown function (DUF4160)
MPVVFRDGGLRYFFFSNEGREPRHIHAKGGWSRTSPSLRAMALIRQNLRVSCALSRNDDL